MQLRKRKIFPFTYFDKALLSLFLVIAFCVSNIIIFNKHLSFIYFEYAKIQATKVATLIINKAVTKYLMQDMDANVLMEVDKDNEGNIKGISFNTNKINKISSQTTNIIQNNIKLIENGEISKVEHLDLDLEIDDNLLKKGIIYEIPFGLIFNNAFFSNVGPKIPVKFHLIGDVISDVKSVIKEYGVNNVLVELDIIIKVQQQVILPLVSEVVSVENSVPLAIKIIQGEVPLYYFGNHSIDDGNIIFPLEGES